MRKRLKIRRGLALFLVLFCMTVMVVPQRLEAAVTGQETEVKLIGTRVGRYQFNYTGNTNHYVRYNTKGGEEVKRIYNDLGGNYANSSVATLNRPNNTSKIKYAYLVWQTRAKQGATSPIRFIAPDGRGAMIYPEYAINDWRVVGSHPGMRSLFCMATDVTDYVKSAGYGNYAVCNIPFFHWGDGGDYGGGESPGSWQLIVIEEDDSFPVRAVTMSMGARFYLGTDFAGDLTLGNGLKSKSEGTTTGQVFFGASNANHYADMTENVSTYNSSGGLIGQVVSNTTPTAGLYRNGNIVNERDRGNGCIRMDLSDVSGNMGNNANRINLTVQNKNWTTSFLLGMAVDIAYPDFEGTQTTTVNSPSSVTVKGEFKNIASTPDTGIYNGNMTIQLDSGLTPASATAVVNGSTTIQGAINGSTVTFSGSAVSSMMNGNNITYTVQCRTNGAGSTVFKNSAGFHGYLRADGTNTGYWIDRMWKASSSAVPKYRLDVQGGTGIESVTGGGDYPYGGKVTIGATVKPGYHWKGWTGSYNTADKDYTFTMPNSNISMRAEAEANAYTVAFHPNDGGEVTHLDSITTQYDKQITFPDGAAYYAKYTLDGKNVTDQVLSGALSLTAESEEVEGQSEADEVTPPEEQPETEAETDGAPPPEAQPEGEPETEETLPEAGTDEVTPPDTGTETEADEVTPPDTETETEADEVTPPTEEPGAEAGASVEKMDLPVTQQPEGSAEAAPEESGAEQAAEQPEAGQKPKVYPSVFMGWSLDADKDNWIPQWEAGETIDVKELVEAAGVTGQNGATVTLYAVWDDCPWIQATDLYYTLEQAQSGFITEEEILSHATASDREDGSPILPGFHENGTSFSIPDYLPTDFTELHKGGSSTENLTVVDSTGSVYKKQITVHVVDTTPVPIKPEGMTRFINEYYYNQPYENGGLEENSVWKTDPEYVEAIQTAFDNMRNDTPIATYYFSHETILEMKEFTREHGIGNSKEPDALQKFYDQFMKPNLK